MNMIYLKNNINLSFQIHSMIKTMYSNILCNVYIELKKPVIKYTGSLILGIFVLIFNNLYTFSINSVYVKLHYYLKYTL